MPKAVAFVATSKPAEARRFYETILGLRFLEEHDFAIVFDAFGTTLRVQKVSTVTPAPYTAFGLEVEDLEGMARDVASAGVLGLRYPHFQQDALGIWTAPGGAQVLWCRDPDGNVVSLTQL